ncbi:MAG: aminoglycoside phosphotransferase family protein [Anaerolineaceae bacterium]|nr:aminoglycoside phosphotransferase family protein [Anaerolineaceae bacterium]
MQSNTKTTIARETIEELVRAQFGNSTQIKEITPLTAGWFNTAYAIQFFNIKPDVVIRIAPHPDQNVLTYEKDLMHRELLILETVQNIESIPNPRLLGHDFSRQLIDRDYMFLEKLSGVALQDVKDSLTPENLHEIERQVGEYVARLGEIKGDHFGYFGDGPGNRSNSWRSAFTAILDAIIHDGEELDAILPISWDELRDLFHQRAQSLDEISEPALVHWDLWAGNVFVKPQNGKYVIEGIIDWERALWGDPDIETAVCCQFYGPSFYEGYGKQLADRGSAAIRQGLYRLYLWLVMIIEAKVRFEDAEHLPWARKQLQKELDFLQNIDPE